MDQAPVESLISIGQAREQEREGPITVGGSIFEWPISFESLILLELSYLNGVNAIEG